VAAAVLSAAGVPEAVLRPATRLVVQPLWFLGLYLLVVALAPAMLRLHRRFGPAVAVWLALAAATADVASRVAGLPGLDRLGDLNFLLVWLFAHQLGFLYADGTLPGWPRRAHLAMAAGGLASLAVLTGSGAWPRSMVGLPGDQVSNMNPPSLCIVALTVWLVGLAMLVRDPVTRWLHRPRPWLLVVTAGSALMTLFLWHLTALVLAVLVLHPLGLTHPTPGTPTWWALRPLWLLVPAAMLVPLVAVFARFEHPGPARSRPILSRPILWIAAGTLFRRAVRSPSGGPRARPDRCLAATTGSPAATTGSPAAAIGTPAAAIGTAAVILGVLGVAVSGIWPLPGPTGDLAGLPINPAASLLALSAGMLLLARSGRPSTPAGTAGVSAPGRPEAPSPMAGPPEGSVVDR
jgi:hypothetical protein